MNMTTEIKSKEESLGALMSRILRVPLDPLSKSINDSFETLLETKDKLDDIDLSISGNGNLVEEMSKSLRRTLNDIKDEVLPSHAQAIQQQVKVLSEASSKKVIDSINTQQQSIDFLKSILNDIKDEVLPGHVQAIQQQIKALSDASSKQVIDSIDAQQQSIDLLNSVLNTTHNPVLGEIYAAQELNQRVITELTRLSAQHEVSEKSLVVQSDGLRAICAGLDDVKQTSTNAMESNQAAMALMLTEQYSAFTAHIALVQFKIQTLTIATGVLFVSILGYVGYDVWSKFN